MWALLAGSVGSVPRGPGRAARGLLLLLLLAPGLPEPGTARAEDAPTAEALLAEARYQQRTLGQLDLALARYAELLALPDVDPRVRGAALWGQAECQAALGRWPEAEASWALILADERLPADVRAKAEQARARRAEDARAADAAAERARTGAEELAERERRRRAQVDALVGRARGAFEQRQFDDALREASGALELEPENPEAQRLLLLIQRERPDRGELLRSLLQWFQIVRSDAFQRVRSRLHELEEAGSVAQRRADFVGADKAYREALAVLDRSEFRSELLQERWNLVFWLRQAMAEGQARGMTFEPEPSAPPESPADLGLKARFYALLGETFAGRDEGKDPIRFTEWAPQRPDDGLPGRSLGPNAFASRGIAVEQSGSDLTRARWAERWIRTNVAQDWPVQDARGPRPVGRRPVATPEPRLLERLGDVLFVQHTEAVHREIAALREAFAPRPPPLQVDVALYAAGPGGTVRIATALGLPAPPVREPGLDAVVGGRLIEECRKDLEGLENVTPLGIAQLRLDGEVAARLEISERTETHPLHARLSPPPLTLPDAASAHFGLTLDVYAEDLPNLPRGARAGAISLLARARLALPSVVVRKPDRGGDWSRLPKFAETVATSDRRLAHAATLVLQGLPNPFIDTADAFPDLVLLVGLRRAGPPGRPAPTPDTPPWQPSSARPEMQQHPLGPLGVEVLDDLVLDGWPEDRGAAQPLPEPVLRESRDAWLAGWIAGQAGLLAPTAPNPVTVREGLASAAAGPEEQARIAAAAELLKANETALVEIDAWVVEASAATVETWSRRPGVTALPGGTAWVVPAALTKALDDDFARLEATPTPYALHARQVARATQQISLRRLAAVGITRQMRVARSAQSEAQRYVPVPGVAEEGLVLGVRPGTEEPGGRVVSLRARAARLKDIEHVPLLGVPGSALVVDVPRWHPLQDRSAGTRLADGDALLLRLPVPEAPGTPLLVRLVTRRLQ